MIYVREAFDQYEASPRLSSPCIPEMCFKTVEIHPTCLVRLHELLFGPTLCCYSTHLLLNSAATATAALYTEDSS